MEALYAKLYSKYSELKTEKSLQAEELNREQELKFRNCVAAAEEMIEFLQSENGKLRGRVDTLQSELASVRTSADEEIGKYQKLLMEESQKNKDLSEEISKLQNHKQEEYATQSADMENIYPPETVPDKFILKSTNKRKRVLSTEDTTDEHTWANKGMDTPLSIQPACPKLINSSGGNFFQFLVESLVGMKVSAFNESDKQCILARHQSSGYSFSLSWNTKSQGEAKLIYRMESLGTLQNIAPKWMKQELVISPDMCRTFFKRVYRVIKRG